MRRVLERAAHLIALGLLPAFVIGVQFGIRHGRWLAAREAPVRIVTPPSFLDACDALLSWRFAGDVGETVYLRKPEVIVNAIRAAEGVPSHGNMALARKYGGHWDVPEDLARGSPRPSCTGNTTPGSAEAAPVSSSSGCATTTPRSGQPTIRSA